MYWVKRKWGDFSFLWQVSTIFWQVSGSKNRSILFYKKNVVSHFFFMTGVNSCQVIKIEVYCAKKRKWCHFSFLWQVSTVAKCKNRTVFSKKKSGVTFIFLTGVNNFLTVLTDGTWWLLCYSIGNCCVYILGDFKGKRASFLFLFSPLYALSLWLVSLSFYFVLLVMLLLCLFVYFYFILLVMLLLCLFILSFCLCLLLTCYFILLVFILLFYVCFYFIFM